ncbi:MAG: phosphoribosylanthranilate isomerase [Bacteroidetes bacterium]|nr:phosphoribosylanthranilate isomerase [Bacteroidota bacterium]
MIKVKVCCISSIEEADLAIKMGADAIGLVSEMPSGPGVISEDLIKKIAAEVPAEILTFLLTSRQNVSEIIKQHKSCGTNTIQIVDSLIEGTHEQLKEALPGINIVQVIHVNDERSIEEAVCISNYVDFILLDSGNQKLKVKELGGTGRTHDWSISKEIVNSVKVPVFLAGGINPDNIKEAADFVKPFGIDLCSGVRTEGKLDELKLKKLFENLNK